MFTVVKSDRYVPSVKPQQHVYWLRPNALIGLRYESQVLIPFEAYVFSVYDALSVEEPTPHPTSLTKFLIHCYAMNSESCKVLEITCES
jgi:hypothetical protein